jgi:arsenate reductase
VTASLLRRAAAEFLGTSGLVTVVVGSGIAAETYSRDPGLQLLENALATTAGLAVLILVFGPVSGAHFNPVVTAAEWFRGRTRGGLSLQDSATYVAAQLAGSIGGCVLANLMYDEGAVSWSTRDRDGAHLLLAEVVATTGLLLVILAVSRAGRPARTAWSVGAYIGAAYWFTSSTSFANPAVTVGRAFTDSFAGIEPGDVPGFLVAQVVGAAIGVAVFTGVYRDDPRPDDLVVPHEDDHTNDSEQKGPHERRT